MWCGNLGGQQWVKLALRVQAEKIIAAPNVSVVNKNLWYRMSSVCAFHHFFFPVWMCRYVYLVEINAFPVQKGFRLVTKSTKWRCVNFDSDHVSLLSAN